MEVFMRLRYCLWPNERREENEEEGEKEGDKEAQIWEEKEEAHK